MWPRTAREAETAWTVTVIGGRIIITVATGTSAVATYIKAQVNPDLSYWWIFAPLLVATLGSVVDTATKTVRAARARRLEEELNDIRQSAVQVLRDVVKAGRLKIDRVGVCVWEVSRHRPFLWKPRLHRIVRFRLDPEPSPSAVDWVKGKGVIGVAWDKKATRHVDWRPIAKRWAGDLSDEVWAKIPADTRYGFTKREFEEICEKYAEVLAVPIIHGTSGSLLGVLSIDIPMDAVGPDEASRLDLPAVKSKAKVTAALVAHTLKHRRV